MGEEYTKLGDLYIYRISLELCDLAWQIYEPFDSRIKKIIGDQFIRSVDSNAANIAEGNGRYHYLDRIKFYYNARVSLLEAKHWAYLLDKRKIIEEQIFQQFMKKVNHVHFQLNNFISTTFEQKKKSEKKN